MNILERFDSGAIVRLTEEEFEEAKDRFEEESDD